jgi:hypothetical protein
MGHQILHRLTVETTKFGGGANNTDDVLVMMMVWLVHLLTQEIQHQVMQLELQNISGHGRYK